MKPFKEIKKWFENQENLFYLFPMILIVPNIVLYFMGPMPIVAKVCNVLLPFSIYYMVMSWSRGRDKTLQILFPLLFFGALQIVLLYLFGQSVITVDMFLNLVATNSSGALELLNDLIPAIVIVVLLYIPAPTVATVSIIKKWELLELFIHRERKRTRLAMIAGILSLGAAYLFDSHYELKSNLYPTNVCYSIALAFQRTAQTQSYTKTSKDFTFQAKSVHPQKNREVYIMIIRKTSRATNWSIYGYNRETNPKLLKVEGLTALYHVLTESSTTHKSVPMLMSSVLACNFNSVYQQKSIITTFKEAGYQTVFFSNQRYNHSFIDFFGKEADIYNFIKENVKHANYNPSDDGLLELVTTRLAKNTPKQFIVLYIYGLHFNYRGRYPSENAFFLPNFPVGAEVKYRDNLANVYGNSIRYADDFLARLIEVLQEQNTDAAMLYTSDRGEDIFDDSRRLFLHASPVPSYYQMHVPFLLWVSNSYRDHYPSLWENAISNKQKNISSSTSFFHTVLKLGGVTTPYRNDSLSVVNVLLTEKPGVYLNDHNEARSLSEIDMGEGDFEMLRQKEILYRQKQYTNR